MDRGSAPAFDNSAGLAEAHLAGFGPEITPEGVRFRLWAPKIDKVLLKLDGQSQTVPMEKSPDGWFSALVRGAEAGTRYSFVLADGTEVPDPGSRFQPEDVAGPSEVIDQGSFGWTDTAWQGHQWEELVIYELHVGTFTPEGTYRGVIERLDDLRALGVTAIELMPVNDFPGSFGWGYDGVLPFAPDASYGRPEDLKALIDAAHGRGLSVFLDVVYNHFGPEGNYLPAYAPLFTEKHHTPWGAAINYDDKGSEAVRELVVSNVCYWLRDFHFDGLRFDAIHEIRDDSPKHVLQEVVEQARALVTDRHLHLILENARNESHWLTRGPDGRPQAYDGQWNDDIHHVLHVAVTGQDTGYYADFFGRPDLLGRALAEGFAYQGEPKETTGEPLGEPSAFLPPTAFISFIQNHDQVGNRAYGERLASIAPKEACRALAAVYLLAPQIPMLFMGEEWGARQPFLYFTDIQSLAESIRKGRRAEFAGLHAVRDGEEPPDPMVRETVDRCRLEWADREAPEHAEWLALYSELLAVRKTEILPRLFGIKGNAGRYEVIGGQGVRVTWTLGDGASLSLLANLSAKPLELVQEFPDRQIWSEGSLQGTTLSSWGIVWTLTDAA